MQKMHPKRIGLRRMIKTHATFLTVAIGLYFVLSAIFGPEFIISDMRAKFSALADDTITLTAKVLGPPVKPVISGSPACVNDNPVVSLNWPNNENSETFDITRNDSPLITGLTNSNYTDNALSPTRSYNTYAVTARGSMGPGVAVSDPFSIANPEICRPSSSSPTQTIVTLGEKQIETYESAPPITARKPAFSGRTNIPFAIITLALHSSPVIYAATYANENGYWSWTSPESLELGAHTLYATATDPSDPTIIATDIFHFEIVAENIAQQKDDSDDSDSQKRAKKITLQTPTAVLTPPFVQSIAPFEIAVSVENSNYTVLASNKLSFRVDFHKIFPERANKDYRIFYNVVDSRNNLVLEISELLNPAQNKSITRQIAIPFLTPAGNYKISARAYDGRDLIVGEAFFRVEELAVVSIGSTTLTLTEIMQSLSWLILIMLLLFLITLALEHQLSRQALFGITENMLRKKGFFTKRKGVLR